jgi:hypothetical protein
MGCTATQTFPFVPDGKRDKLTYEDLMSGKYKSGNPLENRYFMPVGESAPAHHEFQGILTFPSTVLKIKSHIGDYYPTSFPAFSISFFTFQDYLVPVERDILVDAQGSWGVIIDPGMVWSEADDNGMSRASFPFTLLRPDPNYPRGHNGVATFLYDESQVSSLFVQIVQETNPELKFDMWGQIPISYVPGTVSNQEVVEAQFERELAQQLEVHSWSELEKQYGQGLLNTFNGDLAPEEISVTGLIMDDAVYLQPPMTRYGEYPFPRYMRSHVYSVSKSVGNGIAMLRLAQKYGDQVFELRIADYLEVTAEHDGWNEVTFGDALNMAVGVGNGSHDRYPLDIYADDQPSDKSFWLARTSQDKLAVTFSSDNHPWKPGEIARYINPHAFVLSAAMDAYLKSQEGPDAFLWDMLNEEVFEPIGVYHLPMLHTLEQDGGRGIPIMLLGLYPAVDDIAKITILLQNGGRHGDEQLLSPTKLEEALYRSEIVGLPTGKRFLDGDQAYHMSFWGHPYHTQEDRYIQIPYMQGYGGNSVVLAPNGIAGFRFTDACTYDVEGLIQAIETIRPFLDGWTDPVWLFPKALEKYTQYGFSLEHPVSMVSFESGLWWQGKVSKHSGLVQFRYQPYSPETLGILWDRADSWADLEAFLEQFATALESLGLVINDRGPLETITQNGHRMLIQHVEVMEQGVQYSSIVATWYCDKSSRIYLLYHATTPEFATQQDAQISFQAYIDSFICNE